MSLRKRLAKMLTYMRPMGSRAEWAFIARFILPLAPEVDDYGNLHILVPLVDGSPSRVLWSCHTDTVHREEGRQRIAYDAATQTIQLAPGSTATCLGADDTVGVWLCLEMIKAGIPGHYVFHYGEEHFGIGSRGIVATEPERFAGIDFAIALDRAGTQDVITHQAGERCCSDAFAWSLTLALQDVSAYVPCDSGVYTDTAEYVDIVPECTNLSVGYYLQHSAAEWVDVTHALALRAALCRFDESRLVLDAEGSRDALESFMLDAPNWRDNWRDYSPLDADVVDVSRDVWDYGAFESCDLQDEDREYLQRMGWAMRRRAH